MSKPLDLESALKSLRRLFVRGACFISPLTTRPVPLSEITDHLVTTRKFQRNGSYQNPLLGWRQLDDANNHPDIRVARMCSHREHHSFARKAISKLFL